MTDLPDTLIANPKAEALELGLEQHVFQPLEYDTPPDQQDPLRAFLLLDAAADPEISIVLDAFDEPARCLFDGEAFDQLGDVAPWLAEPRRHGGLWDWFVQEGWGRDWGMILTTRLPMPRVKSHLKKFLRVTDETGEAFFFKFYRPRHFNTYIPAFEPDQRASIGRGIIRFTAEMEGDPTRAVDHMIDPQGGHLSQAVDLVALGDPLRIRPPSPDQVDKILAAARVPDTRKA